jgi:hypothetical protein
LFLAWRFPRLSFSPLLLASPLPGASRLLADPKASFHARTAVASIAFAHIGLPE